MFCKRRRVCSEGESLYRELREEEACWMDISSGGIILPNDISYFTGLCALFISALSLHLECRGGSRTEHRVYGAEYHGSKFEWVSFHTPTTVLYSNRHFMLQSLCFNETKQECFQTSVY